MTSDLRDVDLTDVRAVEPVADEGDALYAVFMIESAHVRLTASLRMFLMTCRRDPRIAVVVVNEGCAISPAALHVLNHTQALLAVRTSAGVFDGQNGARLSRFEDLWNPTGADVHPAFFDAPRGSQAAIVVEAFRSFEAEADQTVGRFADQLTSGFDAAELSRWGIDEPLTFARDHKKLTASVRSQMPVAEPHLMAAADGTFAATSVGRSPHGVMERVTAMIPVGPWDGVNFAELARRAGAVLTQAVAAHYLTMASVTMIPVHDLATGRAISPGVATMPAPLALLAGPRAVHELGLDPTKVPASADVRFLGLKKSPTAIVQFTGSSAPLDQLADFFGLLDLTWLTISA